jgi:hypothetical protein
VWQVQVKEKGSNMKVVGIGTELALGRVLKITREGVIVDCQGKNVTLSFADVETEVFGG